MKKYARLAVELFVYVLNKNDYSTIAGGLKQMIYDDETKLEYIVEAFRFNKKQQKITFIQL